MRIAEEGAAGNGGWVRAGDRRRGSEERAGDRREGRQGPRPPSLDAAPRFAARPSVREFRLAETVFPEMAIALVTAGPAPCGLQETRAATAPAPSARVSGEDALAHPSSRVRDRIETIGDIVRVHRRARPDKPALIFEDRSVSYRALDEQADRIARGLIAHAVGRGVRVAHFGQNTAHYFALLMGVAKAGGVLVGINWRLAPGEVAFIVEDSEARVLVVDAALLDVARAALEEIPAARRPALLLVIEGGARNAQAPDWHDFDSWCEAFPSSDPLVRVDPQDVVYQMYTSGTTGRPKGAEITHHAVIAPRGRDALVAARDPLWHVWNGEEVQLVQAPVFHLTGNVWALIGLHAGATLVVHRTFDPGRIFADVARYRITHAIMVPAMLHALLRHPDFDRADLSSLEYVYYGGSPIALSLQCEAVRRFPCRLVQIYGMTEIGGSACHLPPGEHDPEGRNPAMRAAGLPYPWVEVRIVDRDGRDLPPGEVGEILLKTDTLMRGYWKRPEATAKVIRDGWFHTGDAGFVDARGFVHVEDRVDDMIISGGENVYPAEVEDALLAHPAVLEAAVIGVPSERWGEAVQAVVVRTPGETVDEEELIAFVRARIAHYKAPHAIAFVDSLPRNATGKILRRELRDRYGVGASRDAR